MRATQQLSPTHNRRESAHFKRHRCLLWTPQTTLRVVLAVMMLLLLTGSRADVTEKWAQRYNGPVYPYSQATMAVDASGNVYVTGASYNETSYDYATIKYDRSGNQMLDFPQKSVQPVKRSSPWGNLLQESEQYYVGTRYQIEEFKREAENLATEHGNLVTKARELALWKHL